MGDASRVHQKRVAGSRPEQAQGWNESTGSSRSNKISRHQQHAHLGCRAGTRDFRGLAGCREGTAGTPAATRESNRPQHASEPAMRAAQHCTHTHGRRHAGNDSKRHTVMGWVESSPCCWMTNTGAASLDPAGSVHVTLVSMLPAECAATLRHGELPISTCVHPKDTQRQTPHSNKTEARRQGARRDPTNTAAVRKQGAKPALGARSPNDEPETVSRPPPARGQFLTLEPV